MPVYRYRSIDELPAPARSASAARALAELAALTAALPPLFAAGVYRYRSLEDAAADRERATVARARALAAARRGERA